MRPPRPGSVWTPSRWARRGRYADYVNSPAWARRRRWWFAEHRRRTGQPAVCVVCGNPEVDLHHLDYAKLGREAYEDLLPVCRVHHDRIHAAWDATPHLRRLGRRTATITLIAAMRDAERSDTNRSSGASGVS